MVRQFRSSIDSFFNKDRQLERFNVRFLLTHPAVAGLGYYYITLSGFYSMQDF